FLTSAFRLRPINLKFSNFQYCVQRIHELVDLDRLCKIPEESCCQALLDITVHCIGAERNDRDVSSCRVFSQYSQRFDPAYAGQIYVHQNDIRQGGTRNRYATDAVLRTQETDIGSACNEIRHQHQIRRIIFDVEQGLQLRLSTGSRLVVSCGFGCLCDSLRRSRQAQFDPEHASLADCAFRSDCAPHQPHHPLAYHQADTGTFFDARLSKTVERLEKL